MGISSKTHKKDLSFHTQVSKTIQAHYRLITLRILRNKKEGETLSKNPSYLVCYLYF